VTPDLRAFYRQFRRGVTTNPSSEHLLFVLAGVAILSGGFLAIADAVLDGDTHAFDEAVLLAFRVPGHPELHLGPPWMQDMARDVTSLGSFPVLGLVTVAAIAYLLFVKDRFNAAVIAAATIGGVVLSQTLKSVYDRPRPDLAAGAHALTSSFPSGHAMLSSIVYLSVGALLARAMPLPAERAFTMAFALALTLLVGFSRVYLGVHYPTDVLAGWSLGAAWAALCLISEALVTRVLRVRR